MIDHDEYRLHPTCALIQAGVPVADVLEAASRLAWDFAEYTTASTSTPWTARRSGRG